MYKCPVATATPPDEEKKSRDAMKNNFLKAIFFILLFKNATELP